MARILSEPSEPVVDLIIDTLEEAEVEFEVALPSLVAVIRAIARTFEGDEQVLDEVAVLLDDE